MPLFSKSPKKSKKTSGSTSDDESQSHAHSHRSRSPLKKSSSSRSSKAKDENHKAEQGSPRNSRSFQKSGPNNSPRHPFDPNTTHPLNLPPDQLRRFSALSAMSDPDRMDVDSEGPNGAPVSPPPQSKMPGSFDTPKTNSSNGSANGEGPALPPHKSNPTSPVAPAAPTPEEAEAFKNAGNKLYKAKEYKKAIEEYTKGMSSQITTQDLNLTYFYSC
jgi:DnaJ homolog subfamily C member 7